MKTLILAAIMAMVAQFVDAGALDNPGPAEKRFNVTGLVIQRTQGGLLVECSNYKGGSSGYKRAVGTVFVRGIDQREKSTIKTPAVSDGTFRYVTVLGAEKVVDSYRAAK